MMRRYNRPHQITQGIQYHTWWQRLLGMGYIPAQQCSRCNLQLKETKASRNDLIGPPIYDETNSIFCAARPQHGAQTRLVQLPGKPQQPWQTH